MNNEETTPNQPVRERMIRIQLGPFQLAPAFMHLKDAPMGEFETCDSLAPPSIKMFTATPNEIAAMFVSESLTANEFGEYLGGARADTAAEILEAVRRRCAALGLDLNDRQRETFLQASDRLQQRRMNPPDDTRGAVA